MLGRGDGNLEANLHGEGIDLRLGQLCQLAGGALAFLVKDGGCGAVGCGRCVQFGLELLQDFVAVFHFGELAGDFFAKRDHLGDILAVLAFQAIERGQAVFNFGQPLGRGIDSLGVVAQAEGRSPSVARAEASCCAASVNRPS